jgi:hypothetical protein
MPTWRLRRHSINQPVAIIAIALLCLALAGSLLPGDASAHFNKDVGDGKYRIQLGFRDEPTYAGLPNALYLKVEQYATGGTKPVDDLAATLTAEVSKDGQTFSQPLVPTGDGQYELRFVPTATGDYTFHITGKIGDAAIDESVTSGPNTFDTVQPLNAIAFPAPQPDPASLQAADAQADAAMARTLAIAGIVAGALGLIVSVIAMSRSGRTRTEVASTPIAAEPTGKLLR